MNRRARALQEGAGCRTSPIGRQYNIGSRVVGDGRGSRMQRTHGAVDWQFRHEERPFAAACRMLYSARPTPVVQPDMASPFPTSSSDDRDVLPRWVRGADLLVPLLAGLAVVVAIGGGFRERIGIVRIAVTSPYGLLLAAVAVAVLRSLVVPRPPLHLALARRLRMWHSPASRAAWYALLTTRPIILFVGYFAVATFGSTYERPPTRYSDNEFVNLQNRFDTAWYVDIATKGYEFRNQPPTEAQRIVFFPAFPMALRVVGRLFGGSVGAYLLGGTVVSWAAFFWALTYLYRLARDLLGTDQLARVAVLLLAAYPFAFFYGAVYSESLFLLGAVAAFYHTRQQEYGRAAVWGLLVGLTRPNGCFLAAPLALMALRAWVPQRLYGGAAVEDSARAGAGAEPGNGRLLRGLASAAAPVVGMALYSAYIWHLTGNPIAWAEGHAAWGRVYSGLLPLLQRYYSYFREDGGYSLTVVLPYDVLNALGALFVLALALPVWRRFGLPYAVFILINMLPPLAAGGFLSTGRFSAVMFPAFLWLASEVPEVQRAGWLINFMALQAFNAALFYDWRRLY